MTPSSPTPGTTKLIGTHDGAFHCDEALAVYLLRQTAAYADAPVMRTRDPEQLAKANVVVDVGGVYDPKNHRYDHHQRGFSEFFSPLHGTTKLSSAGLVYKHFGREVLENVLKKSGITLHADAIYKPVYDAFIEAVDAVDNGVSIQEGIPKYRSSTDLSSRVGHLNAPWNAVPGSKRANQELNFQLAVGLTGREFEDAVVRTATEWYPAREVVAKAFDSRTSDWTGGEIMVMRDWAPWKNHLYEIEKDAGENKVLYVVYEDQTKRGWRVQCVPVAPGSFESRRPLPEKWRGVRNEELSKLTGIDGCVFVHASGFIGGNATFDGAMQMVKKALQLTANIGK